MIDTGVLLLGVLAWAIWVARSGLVAAQMFQIEEYETARLFAWGRNRGWLYHQAVIIGSSGALLVGLLTLILPTTWHIAGAGTSLLAGATTQNLLWKRPPDKKPIVYTPRMRRILGASLSLIILIAVIIILIATRMPVIFAIVGSMLLCLQAPRIALDIVVGGNFLMTPVETSVRRGFLKRAHVRMEDYQPRVIGIAGSYGKTSTKHITAQLITAQIPTLATPKSFNTLMGITRTINEYLESHHRLFLVEMDAYAQGEIADMCNLVKPSIAVITSVGPQHLERFGTIDRIADALYELVAALPHGSPAIIYCGDPETAHIAERAANDGYRVVRYAIADETTKTLDVVASDIVIADGATHFTWTWEAEGLEQRVTIPLLGQHNILNTSAALAVAHLLGASVDDAVQQSQHLEPVPHRLQLLPNSGGMTVIDDSYNANPVGIHNGIDVLEQMPGNAKILVTPGLVELGSVEDIENHRLGEHAARVCSHVILVGERQTTHIKAGLEESGFTPEHIHIVQSLAEVTALLGRITGPGDVVLFANDLPDTYLEL